MKNLVVLLSLCFLTFASSAQTNGIVVPMGHSSSIKSFILDNQQKYVYGLELNRVIMWELRTGRQLYTFDLSGAENISDFSLSSDGNKLVVVSKNFTIVFSTLDGKEIYRVSEGIVTNAIFSEDGSKLYLTNREFFREGFHEVDMQTKTKKLIKNCTTDDKNCPINGAISKLNGNEWLVLVKDGWCIYDVNTKRQTIKVELPLTQIDRRGDAIYRTYEVLPLQNYVLMTGQDTLHIYDIRTGKLMKSFKSYNALRAISSTDGNYLGFRNYQSGNQIWFYNAKSFQVEKTFDQNILSAKPVTDSRDEVDVAAALLLSESNQLLMAYRDQLNLLDLKTKKIVKTYSRQMTDYNIDFPSNRDYNYKRQLLSFLSDDSIFRSIDLKRLVPLRNKNLGAIGYPNVSFSNTTDTVAVFSFEGKGHLRNTKTNKRTLLNFVTKDQAGANTDLPDFFFSKDGIHGYVYTTVLAREDRYTKTLHRVNLKTGVKDQAIVYAGDVAHHQDYLDVDKEILTVFTQTATSVSIKTWNLKTAKVIINKTYPAATWKMFASPIITISADGGKIAYIMHDKTECYSLATGALLYTSSMTGRGGWRRTMIGNRSLSQFISFEEGMLRSQDSTGKIKYEIKAHNSSIDAAYLSDDDRILFTLGSDATIKVWDSNNGVFYGTLYVFKESNDYVFLDKYGRFDGTADGIKKIYYLSGRSVIPLDVVYEKFYTPNLYLRLINGETFEPIEMQIKPLPLVKVNYAAAQRNLDVVEDDVPSYQNTTGFAEITVKANAPQDAVDEIRLFHNGKIVTLTTRNLIVTDDKSESSSKTYQLTLLPGPNNIRAVALNTQRTESQPDEILVNFNNGAGNASVPRPVVNGKALVDAVDKNATLHLIVVGINQYKNPKMSLNYALADATAFKAEAEKGAKTLIGNVKSYFVTDEKADRSGIEQAFKDVQKNAKPEDVLMFYYAGHGVISEKNKEFYLVPTDVADLKNVDAALAEKGIPSKLLQQYAIDIAAQKQVFILDACQSAGAFETLLKGDGDQQKSLAVVARSTGTHWIAASGSQQFANEFSDLGHGAFTYVLLKAMSGEAKSNNMITVNGLKNFLQVQVPELMKKYNGTPQYPSSFGLGNDFPVEVMLK